MTIPRITGVELAGDATLPLLIVGPSLGTGVATLWSPVATRLDDAFHVVGWNLPGHAGAPVAEPYDLAELAAGVRTFAAGVVQARAAAAPTRPGRSPHSAGGEAPLGVYVAGDSLGGAVALQWLLDAPEEVAGAALICTGARIGDAQGWHDRAATVRASGTPVMVTGSAERWFAKGFIEQHPETATALLADLQHADAEGYARACEALAGFDVRHRLREITRPVLAIAGDEDAPTPPASLAQIADGVCDGRLEVLDGVAHLAPAEAPGRVAGLLRRLLPRHTEQTTYDAGMVVRREVLGDAHVDRANAAVTELTEEFQELITRYAWGTIWTRPGLTRRDRSIAVLTALIARGHHEELAMHLRAAVRNGLTVDEIKEVVLQSAIYCGVPDANTAFRIAREVLEGQEG
ncbi:MAG: 4-carboxymuconolactone decarboxylase [Nocardioides sp.]